MNDVKCHGKCVIIPLSSHSSTNTLLDNLKNNTSVTPLQSNDIGYNGTKSYVFDTSEKANTFSSKSSSSTSTLSKDSKKNIPDHKTDEEKIFIRKSNQSFIVSRSVDDISIDGILFSKKSYHCDLVKIKSDFISSTNTKNNPADTNTKNFTKPEMSKKLPIEVVLNSRLCKPSKISETIIKKNVKEMNDDKKITRRTTRSFSVSDSTGRKIQPPKINLEIPELRPFKPVRYLTFSDIVIDNKTKNVTKSDTNTSSKIEKEKNESNSSSKTKSSIKSSPNNTKKNDLDGDDESEYDIVSDQTQIRKKNVIPGLNFIPVSSSSLLDKTSYLGNYSLADWVEIYDIMLNYNLSFSDAQRMKIVGSEIDVKKTLFDIASSRRKYREINLSIPLFELHNTYKISFDIHLLNSENPQIMDNLLINMVSTLISKKEDEQNSEDSDTDKDDSDDYDNNTRDNDDTDGVQKKIREIVQDFENNRPKKPLCYVVTIDLTDKNVNFTKSKQLLEQIYKWMVIDSIPEGFYETFIGGNSSDDVDNNKTLRERIFLNFLKTNLMAKNKSFVVLMANLPSKYVTAQLEELIGNMKKKNSDMEDINVVTPRNEDEKNNNDDKIPKKDSETNTKIHNDEDIMVTVESNTKKILSIAKKVFYNNFFFMNFDFCEPLQVNYAFQKISTKILNFSIGDFSNFKLHALPSKDNYSTTIRNYSKNTIYNSVQDGNSSWDIVKSFSLDLISSVYNT